MRHTSLQYNDKTDGMSQKHLSNCFEHCSTLQHSVNRMQKPNKIANQGT